MLSNRGIESKNLFADPKILVSLLDLSNDAETKSNLSQHLERLTGRSHGTNTADWPAWLRESEKLIGNPDLVSANNEPPKAFGESVGPFFNIELSMTNLVPLVFNTGRLKLDREEWAQQFDGKSVPQMASDLTKYAQDLGLPSQWLNFDE